MTADGAEEAQAEAEVPSPKVIHRKQKVTDLRAAQSERKPSVGNSITGAGSANRRLHIFLFHID